MLKKFGHIKSKSTALLASVMIAGILSFGAYQAFKPKPAEAFRCFCGNPCTFPGAGVVQGWAQGLSHIGTQFDISGTSITSLYAELMTSYTQVISEELVTALENLSDFLDNFLIYDLTPAMQEQTGQLNTMLVDQNRQLSSALDGQMMNQTMRVRDMEQARSHREATPSETVCVSGTMAGGMSRSRVISKAMARALPAASLGISGNQTDSPAEFGNAGYQRERLENHLALYCNPESNGGEGCLGNPAGPYTDHDILVREVLFKENTIDLVDTPGRLEAVEDLVTNLIEPTVANPAPASAFGTLGGQEAYLQNRSIRAQRSLAKKVVYDIVARRAPGSRMQDYVQELRASAGVDLVDMSDNPSWNEMINAMAEERFWTGVYNMDNIVEPEAVTREKVAVQAMELLQLNDVLEQYRNISMLSASQAAHNTLTTARDRGLADVVTTDE